MKTATVREFKINASRFLGGRDDVVVTRHGRPVAVVTPVPAGSMRSLLLEIRGIFKLSGVTKRDALMALKEARREVYGSRRS
jgi:antitoxin (DNA-binding transcriptional repressor) of toxin-antitoxin stability system